MRIRIRKPICSTSRIYGVPSNDGNFVIDVKFCYHFEKNFGAPARLSLTAIDFAQKQSDHDIFFSFKVRSYKI
jgi:hypothetical protein